MGRGRMFLERLAEEADIAAEGVANQSVVELAVDNRVLIENHFGVMGYSTERILVKVKYGCVCVCGCGLQLVRMTREQLVIRGKINGITVQRREKR